ncbi:hypothetical protein ACFRLW_39135 [Streptomyces sp. NPDC056728]|uniref:hypothetical protein n=1 Tax=unclassified Streptomyces TaxID=2593676 RepID=UPI00363FAA37
MWQLAPSAHGPRARRYCSRACQGKAYRTRQQRDAHRLALGDEDSLLAGYDGVPALELADQLALAARRLAGALVAGQPADDFDLVARIPTVLAARAHRAAPAAQALHGTLVRRAAETSTVIDLSPAPPPPARTSPPPGTHPPPAIAPKRHVTIQG